MLSYGLREFLVEAFLSVSYVVCTYLSLLLQRVSDKKSELKALDRKVRPMEDMFAKFRSWLEESKTGLSALSPAPSLAQEAEREKAIKQAQVCGMACVLDCRYAW